MLSHGRQASILDFQLEISKVHARRDAVLKLEVIEAY
jgi:hypothetical protein